MLVLHGKGLRQAFDNVAGKHGEGSLLFTGKTSSLTVEQGSKNRSFCCWNALGQECYDNA